MSRPADALRAGTAVANLRIGYDEEGGRRPRFETRRNIIPLMFDGLDFGASIGIGNQLHRRPGYTQELQRATGSGCRPSHEAMGRLREQYLNVPLEMVLHPASTSTQEDAKAQKATLVKLSQLIPEEQRRIEEDRDGVEQKVEQRRLEAEARRTGEEAKEKTDVLDQRRTEQVPSPWRKYGPAVASVAVVLIFSFVFWWLKRQEPERAERREPPKESLPATSKRT